MDDSHGAAPAPGYHAMLARVLLEACAAAGDMRAGLAAADRALGMSGIRVWEAEVRRLRAGFLAALGASSPDIEAELACALEVARRQGAMTLELRVLVSLLRHRLERGAGQRVAEARDRLAALIAALPEGRDTPDLREAAALLAQT
jgi:hypothetical protein